MPVPRWIKGSPGGTQPRSVTHGCGTPCCKALSQGSRGRHGRLPALPPRLRAEATGRGHLSGRVLFPSLLMSSADHSWKSLITCFLEGNQPCGQMGRAVQPRGGLWIPLPTAGRAQVVPASWAADAPSSSVLRWPGCLCLPVTADSGLHAAGAGRVSLDVLPVSA